MINNAMMTGFQHFELLFKASPSACLVLIPDAPHFTIAEVNDAYCRITGSNRNDLLGKKLFDAFPENPEDLAGGRINFTRSLEQVISTKTASKMKNQRFDIPVRGTKAYHARYWSAENFPVLDENGDLSFIIHTTTDITAQVITEKGQKRAIKELQEHHEHYRSLFDNNPDAVFSFNMEGGFLSGNDGLARLAECSLEDLMKLTFVRFVAPEDADRVFGHFKRASEGKIQNYNTGMITAKGKWLIVNVTNIPITVNNKIVGVYGIAKDITRTEQGRQKLRLQKQQLKKIMDSSRDVICTINEEQEFVKVSNASATIWGYLPKELEGRPYMDLIVKTDHETMNKTAGKVRSGINLENFENRYHRKDGQIITMSWSVRWDDKEKIAYCVGRDITEAKAAAEIVKNNEKRLSALLKNSNDGLALIAADGTILEISEKGKQIAGYGENEPARQEMLDLIHPADLPIIKRTFKDIAASPGIVRTFEFRLLLKTGHYKWLEANFQNQLNEPFVNAVVMNFRDITERKTSSEKLRSSEERYRNLFHSNPLPMWIYDMDTLRFIEVNRSAVEKYGYREEEFLKMTIKDIQPKEDMERLAAFQGVRTSYGIRYEGSWRHLKKTGELIYVDVSSHLIDYEGKKADMVLVNDITEKIKASEALRTSEETRKLIMNSALDAIICMDLKGLVTLWSNQAEKIFGWKSEEMIGKALSEYIIPEAYRARHQAGIKRYLEAGTGSSINQIVEATALNRMGAEFPVELTIVHIKQADSEFFCAFIRDITDRKEFLTALDLSEKHYKTLIQEGSDLIAILNEKGYCSYASSTYISQLAIKPEKELIGRYFFDMIHKGDREQTLNVFERLKNEKSVKSLPFRFKDGKGKYRWLEFTGTNLLDEPSVKGFVINSKDVTERVDHIRSREEQNAKLREIAWMQSHIVRAPLARLMGLTELLREGLYLDGGRSQLESHILSSANELDITLRDIVKKTERFES